MEGFVYQGEECDSTGWRELDYPAYIQIPTLPLPSYGVMGKALLSLCLKSASVGNYSVYIRRRTWEVHDLIHI